MRLFPLLVLVLSFAQALIAAATQPVPPGWVTPSVAIDPAVHALSTATLIDRLQDAEPDFSPPQNRAKFWAIGGVPRLGVSVAFRSGAAVELVRRGVSALPALLEHLSDARRTKMIYVVRPFGPANGTGAAYSDEYDPREPGHVTVAVNTKLRRQLDEDGTYTFKVGDLCYAAVGQIVGRELKAVRSGDDDADIISGVFSANPGDRFVSINSPVAVPALADAVRADWSDLSTTQHLQLLREQSELPVRRHSVNEPGLVRLLFYHPTAGAEFAERLLHRRLGRGRAAPGEPKPGDEAVTFGWQAMLVRQLSPFHWDGLDQALLDSIHEAGRIAEEELKALPANTWEPSIQALGSDLALQCAWQLLHRGHDEELRAFFTRRAEQIEASLTPAVTAARDQGTLAMVNSYQAQECRKFVAALKGEIPPISPAARTISEPPKVQGQATLGQVTLKREASGVSVQVSLVDPPMADVLLGRLAITRAQDESGVTLLQGYIPNLAPTAVGMRSERDLTGMPAPSLTANLTSAAPKSKTLRTLQGWVEVVVPKRDPNATVRITDVASHLGTPLSDPALSQAGISITLRSGASPRSVTPPTRPANPEEMMAMMRKAAEQPQLYLGDVALTTTDPQHRFLSVEFCGPDGSPLRYNHNGSQHAELDGSRLDVYRVGDEIPPGTIAVIHLLTEKSRIVAPIDLRDVPLPDKP